MPSPVIGITISRNEIKDRSYNQSPSAYAEAITLAGGLPLLIPNEFPLDHIPDLLEKIDGLLLAGGGDIDIHAYNGEPHPSISGVVKDRDRLEFALLKLALSMNKPVFGVCRGVQMINVALGGTLYTHIPAQYKTAIEHSTPVEKGRDFLAHEVVLKQESIAGKAIEESRIAVNSFHHQAIKDLAQGLVVTANATDGLIEAVELQGYRKFVMGVQWHPECLLSSQAQLALFSAFLNAC